MAYITFENVTKVYRSGEQEVRALDGMSFTVEKGELCVIVGPSVQEKPRCSTFSAAWTVSAAEACAWGIFASTA